MLKLLHEKLLHQTCQPSRINFAETFFHFKLLHQSNEITHQIFFPVKTNKMAPTNSSLWNQIQLSNSTFVPDNHSETSEFTPQVSLTLNKILYSAVRHVQLIVGIIGNVLTLIIIRNRKARANGHILMVYLAVSDMCVCCMAPLSAAVEIKTEGNLWKVLCTVKNYVYYIAMLGSVMSYLLLSTDR